MDNAEITYQLSLLSRAIATLREGIAIEHPTQIEKDGIVQRFEYTSELAWKSIRKFFLYKGVNIDGLYPKDILKLAWEKKIIDDRERWLSYIDIRNSLSHSYDHTIADRYYEDISQSGNYFLELFEKLQMGVTL